MLLPRGEGEEALRPDLALVDFANQMKLEYANIATILGMCTDTDPYYIIYEYLDQVSTLPSIRAYRCCCCVAITTTGPALLACNMILNPGM